MKVTRSVTFVTANLGRGATRGEFRDNVKRMKDHIEGRHIFYGFQEIDEDDVPEEMKHLQHVFGDTHRFVGTKTREPILIPRTFRIKKRVIEKGSDGVKGLQPDRYTVQAIVTPATLETDRLLGFANSHFGREIPELEDERKIDFNNLRRTIDTGISTVVTGDFNSENYPPLDPKEKRFVTAHLDYIRGVQREGSHLRLINRGSVRLTGDNHNAQWANVQITWP